MKKNFKENRVWISGQKLPFKLHFFSVKMKIRDSLVTI